MRFNSIFGGMVCGAALLLACAGTSVAQTADELAGRYKREAMEQALQTAERYNHYGLRFETDASSMNESAKALLDDIAAALKAFPDWRLRIVGHTDSSGSAAHNLTLSAERASAVQAALLERGVDAKRLAVMGAGESQPAATNDTPEGRALNRRVELVRFTDSAEARSLLKSMTDFLGAQKALSFGFDSTLEVVTPRDQKIGLTASGTAVLNRPDKLRVSRQGGFTDMELLFDGRNLTVFGRNANAYAQFEAPGTIDHLIDELKSKHQVAMPGADLLLSNAYEELVKDVYDAKDLGSGVIDGKECDSIAFRKDDVDWQIWIAQGSRPFPCKFTVTSRAVKAEPQHTIQFRDWRSDSDVAATDFTFTAPANARVIDVSKVAGQFSEIPSHFVVGETK